MAASILGDGESILDEIPNLTDVKIMCDLLESFGVNVKFTEEESKLHIILKDIINTTAPYELVNKMRASILVMGPLLARTGVAKISLPGGCAIGTRPVDLHLKGFAAMGAQINQGHGYIEARVDGKLRGSKIYLDFPAWVQLKI